MKDSEIQLSSQTSSGFSDLLLTLAGPAIYRQNAFRALALPVDSTSQRLLRQADSLRISTKLGGTEPALQGPLLLNPLPVADEVNQFVQRYRDPQIRLIDEFFWFWPEEFGKSSDDEALAALGQGDLSAAVSTWRAQEDTPGQGFIARHNLAVLYHTAALDLEHLDRSHPLSTVQIQQRDRYWQEAFSRWGSVISAREMWDYISLLITNLDDPRVPREAALELEAHVAGTVLAINAKLAVAAAEKRLEAEALRHARYLLDSRFPAASIEKAVQQGIAMIGRLVKATCGGAEPEANANAEKGHAVAKRVLGQTSVLTLLLDSWRPKDDAILIGMHDEIALCALDCEIAFVNQTRRWQESIEVFETCLELAASDSARQRIEKSLSTVKENAKVVQLRVARQTLIDPLAEQIADFCAEHSESPETRFEQLATMARGELKNIIDQRGEGEEISNEASNLLARAMLACATDLIDNGMFQTAKEALILAKEICRDSDLDNELEGECHRLDSEIEENEASLDEEPSYLPLLDTARPDLYRLNAFRLTGLPVDASQQMVSRQIEKLRMMEKLGVGNQQTSGPLALVPPPEQHAVSEAIQRLRDPERRLLDEVFWFWPVEPEAGTTDLALAALEKGSIDLAWENWTRQENSGTVGVIATHNLAVLAHVLALDLEYQAKTSPVSKTSKRDYYWLEAIKRWRLLTRDRDFWKLVANRIARLDDPRVTQDLVPKLRASLPLAILSINAQLAVAAAEQGKTFDAERLLKIMKRWFVDSERQLPSDGLSVEGPFLRLIEKSLQKAIAPLQERIKLACQAAEEAATANPASVVQTARTLLDQASPMLQVLECLLPENHPIRTGHHDQVALQARSCVIAYTNTAEHNPLLCKKLLEECITLAATESARKRLTKDLADLDEYVESQKIKKWIDPIAADLNATFELEVTLPAKYYRLRDLSKRHLDALRSEVGEGAQALSIASNLLAQALRRISVELHNQEERYELSYEALKLALSLVRDPELKAKLNEDLGAVREHAEQEKLYKDLTPIKSAPGLWSINGFGTTLYGSSDFDQKTQSFLACLYFIFFFIPIFPIARYRVVSGDGRSYRFLGKAPLRPFDKWHRALVTIVLVGWLVSSAVETPQQNRNDATRNDSNPPAATVSQVGDRERWQSPALPKVPIGMRRISHQVARGETVESIAATYGTTGDAVRKWNNLPANYQPQVGALLKVSIADSGKKHKPGGYQIPSAPKLQDLPIESPGVIYQPPSLPTLSSSDRALLKQELEAERPRLEEMKSQLAQIAKQIEAYDETLAGIEREQEVGNPVDREEYERILTSRNSLVRGYNLLLKERRAKVAEFNETVKMYNHLR